MFNCNLSNQPRRVYLYLASCLVFLFQGLSPALGDDYRFPEHIGLGFRDLFNSDNLPVLGVGVGATVLSFYFDERLANHFRENPSSLGKAGEVALDLKAETFPLIASGLFIGYGLIFNKDKELNVGQGQLEAIVSYTVSVAALKFLTYRNGPQDGLHHAFPSGQTLFVTAGNLYKNYGLEWAAPLIVIGTVGVVHYTMIAQHWLSDLVFGATLGFAMGSAFADHHLQTASKTAAFQAYPIVSHSAEAGAIYGLGFNFQF